MADLQRVGDVKKLSIVSIPVIVNLRGKASTSQFHELRPQKILTLNGVKTFMRSFQHLTGNEQSEVVNEMRCLSTNSTLKSCKVATKILYLKSW